MKTEEIAAQLRESIRSVSGLKPSGLMTEAADALEAQAAEIARLREALRPLAATKARHVTVDAIGCAIIEATGDGPWSDHVCDLLTIHAEAARFALATPTTPEETSR